MPHRAEHARCCARMTFCAALLQTRWERRLPPCMNAPERPSLRLTRFSHGGGCGCKIAPGVLQLSLGRVVRGLFSVARLVGIVTADDAAFYRLN